MDIKDQINRKTYHYFYKITNKINGMFYYGIHSTDNLDDGYMGSGKLLKTAIKKYGLENFDKEIIKFFNTLKELSDYEALIVNEELIKNDQCYNMVVGGYFLDDNSIYKRQQYFSKSNHQRGQNNSQYGKCWITKNENSITIHKSDLEEYLQKGWVKGRVIKNKDKIKKSNKNRRHIWKDGVSKHIYIEELDKYLNDGWIIGRKDPNDKKIINKISKLDAINNLIEYNIKYVKVRDKNNNIFVVEKTDPRYLSGELIHYMKNMVNVIDIDGNKFTVNIDDPRYLSGELTPRSGNFNRIAIRDANGKYSNINLDDPMLNDPNCLKSTKGLKCINNGNENKYIDKYLVDDFLKNNKEWKLGRVKKK